MLSWYARMRPRGGSSKSSARDRRLKSSAEKSVQNWTSAAMAQAWAQSCSCLEGMVVVAEPVSSTQAGTEGAGPGPLRAVPPIRQESLRSLAEGMPAGGSGVKTTWSSSSGWKEGITSLVELWVGSTIIGREVSSSDELPVRLSIWRNCLRKGHERSRAM